MLIVYGLCEITPFGPYSLACGDGDIQYLDFFAYFKDVLEGKNSIVYTFSSFLGSSAFGLYAYYLASPVSLLVVLFPKEQIPLFFDLAILIKLFLCAATMAYYLARRFCVCTKVRFLLCTALAVSYALSVWMVYQASNIMWLDAAYLLPVLLLGLWRGVREGRWWVFSVAVGCSLMFGWYTGAMNCLFSIFWLFFEIAAQWADLGNSLKEKIKRSARILLGYVGSGIVGVMLASIMLIPMLFVTAGSSRGFLDLNMLSNFAFVRDAMDFAQNYVVGSSVSNSCYAGSLVLVGLIGVFCDNKGCVRQKTVIACGIAFVLLMLCWGPFAGLFVLLHQADSYHIRYSYLAIAALVVFAGFYFLQASGGLLKKKVTRRVILVAVAFFCVQLALNYSVSASTAKHFLPLCAFEGLLLLLLAIGSRKGRRIVCAFLMAFVAFGDAGTNAKMIIDATKILNVESFASWTTQNEEAIALLKEQGDSSTPYRISAVTSRAGENEALAFGYDSIQGYSSIAPADQMALLSWLGYPTYGNCMTIIPDAILPTDALLGVKYLSSQWPIPGLSEDNALFGRQILTGSDKELTLTFYENPYAFPLAFTTGSNAKLASPVYQGNTFEYLNSVLEAVLSVGGVYERVDYAVEIIEPDETDTVGKTIYRLGPLEEDAVVWASFSNAISGSCTVELSNGGILSYGGWGSRSVFNVPVASDASEMTVICSRKATAARLAQFYKANFDKLEEAARIANERAAVFEEFENGSVTLSVEAQRGKKLFLSLPNDPRWHALVNGREATISTATGCLMMIPLDEGQNHVELRYDAASYLPGAVISLSAIAIMSGYGLHRRRLKAKTSVGLRV